MKELDKAIQNNDVDRIAFLLSQKVDCEGAVLMHVKEQLVPAHFTEEELRARGAIMSLEELHEAIKRHTEMGLSEDSAKPHRMDFYIRRLYLSSTQALKMWQTGQVANKELENSWDIEATQYLISKWIKNELPGELQTYAEKAQQKYVEVKYFDWASGALDEETSLLIDQSLCSSLRNSWEHGDTESDLVCREIRSNITDEAVRVVRSNGDTEFAKDVLGYLRGKAREQIFNGDINKESIKYALEDEVSQQIQGRIVPNLASHYEQAVHTLFAKWQAGTLSEQVFADVTNYIKKQFLTYPLAGSLKAELLEKAIPQLLAQYRKGVLSREVTELLALQFKGNVVGYYEKNALKDSAFRNEVSQVIFLALLREWKAQKLEVEKSALQYLQSHLLSDFQKTLQEFGLPTSRFTLYVMVTRLVGKVAQLEQEISALKASKESAPLALGSGNTIPKESDASLAVAAQQHGVFKPTQPTSSALFKDAVVIPKQPQGPGSK